MKTTKLKYQKPASFATKAAWVQFLTQFHGGKRAEAIADAVRQKAASRPIPAVPMKREKCRITDPALAQQARSNAERQNRRIQNWTNASASFKSGFDYHTNNLGQYSRKCRYTHYTYTPTYHSAATIAKGGCGVLYRAADGFSRVIPAPKGMRFESDQNGLVLVRKSDGMDYHATSVDIRDKAFATRIRRQMAENFTRRVEAKRTEREQARFARIFKRDLPSTRVTLADSRRAGNCVEGSLAFAERKLGIPRADVLAAAYLVSVPASRLLSVANGDKPRVEAAVRAAWQRETTVSI